MRIWSVIINEAIEKLDLENFKSIALGEVSNEDKISHRVVHFKVNPSRYWNRTLTMASEYVVEKTLNKYVGHRERALRTFIAESEGISLLANTRAAMFEGLAHRVLSAGGRFSIRSLDDWTKRKLTLSPTKFTQFSDISKCTDPEAYYKPKKMNHPCIDSLILKVGYFQMTTSLDHPIEKNPVKAIVGKMKMDKFYFVVPSTSFEEFQKQNFKDDADAEVTVGSTKKQASLKRRPLDKVDNSNKSRKRKLTKTNARTDFQNDLVRQFVLSIPV